MALQSQVGRIIGQEDRALRIRATLLSLLLVAAVLLPVGRAPAQDSDPDFVFSSGREGGNYHAVALRLRNLLPGRPVGILPSRGSRENLSRLADPGSPVNLAFTQADALSQHIAQNPAFADQFAVLADIGKECALVIAGRGSGIESAADLKVAKGRRISVDSEESGGAVTWESLTRIEPAFLATSAVYVDLMESLAQIKSAGDFSPIKAALFVQDPSVESPPVRIVLENPDTFRFVQIGEGDLESPVLPGGLSVYAFERIRIGGRAFNTICTRALLIASNPKLAQEKRGELSKLLLQARFLPPGAR